MKRHCRRHHRPAWEKGHQKEQKLNEKEAKWVSGPSSLLCLQEEEEGKSEGGFRFVMVGSKNSEVSKW